MATHSHILAWRIPRTEQSGRLQSMGSPRIGHDWANGTPLQCSCLENPTDGGAWWAAVDGVTGSRTRLSDFTFTFHFHALEKEMATHSSVLAGESCGQRSLVGCCPWGHIVGHDWSDLACIHALEKAMAAHSSVLAWRIPGTGQPDGLPSMGSHRVGHDWSDLAAAAELLTLSLLICKYIISTKFEKISTVFCQLFWVSFDFFFHSGTQIILVLDHLKCPTDWRGSVHYVQSSFPSLFRMCNF